KQARGPKTGETNEENINKPCAEDILAQELSCPICLQLFCNPVVLPCGHNYCLTCIKKATLCENAPKGQSQCPECRRDFGGPDSLQKNFKLSSIVEHFQASLLGGGNSVPGEIWSKCKQHNQVLEYYCGSDRGFLCSTCVAEGDHQNHEVQTFAAAEAEMRHLLEIQSKAVADRLQMTQSLLQTATEGNQGGASAAAAEKLVTQVGKLLDAMKSLANLFQQEMKKHVEQEQRQQQKNWDQCVDLLKDQAQSLCEYQEDITRVLAETAEPLFIIGFLQVEPKLKEVLSSSIPQAPERIAFSAKKLSTSLNSEDFRAEMGQLHQELHSLLNPLELTFNPNTAHVNLLLSKDLQTVKFSSNKQPYQENPERFTTAVQVLCTQGFSNGQHAWVVEVSSQSMWSVGASYRNVPRKGDHSRMGHNSASWRLQWKNKKLTVCHGSNSFALADAPPTPPQRLEVMLDYEGGRLSFYNSKSRKEHLHTFRALFQETLYPAFALHSSNENSWITLQSKV
uniref:Uncharacterized protein n=1 Tax=Denticeps clupeoides TaxID=299321 RepID=A0AAY4DB88_9TELE